MIENLHLPYSTVGIEPLDGRRIAVAIEQFINECPDSSVNVQSVSQLSGIHPNSVKDVLYLLLSYRKLKATFLPVHKRCGHAIGDQETSKTRIIEKFESDEINWCNYCHEPIDDFDDIKIQIIFWKLGKNVF